MRKLLFLAAVVFVAAGCSSPKYAYKFSMHSYAKKDSKSEMIPAIDPATVVASSEVTPVIMPESVTMPETGTQKKYADMTKVEKKAFRKEVKQELKSYIKDVKAGKKDNTIKATNAMDHDMKLAALFGAVGLTMLIIGGQVFYVLGAIAMIIAVVFFVQWLMRQ